MKKLFLTILKNVLFLVIFFNHAQASIWPIEKMQNFAGYADWDDWSELSSRQRDSLRRYQSSPTINFFLRTNRALTENSRSQIRDLDKIIAKKTFPADLLLFRTATLEYRDNEPYKTGDEFIDAGYTSTSINSKVVDDIANVREKISVIYIIYSQEEFQGLWIGNSSLLDYRQEEVVLARNSKFKVMATKVKHQRFVQILQKCKETCEDDIIHPDVKSIFSDY